MKNRYPILIGLFFLYNVTSCNKENCIEKSSDPVFIHKVFNDTFQVNVLYGPGPEFQDANEYDTLYYDINNDNRFDIRAAYGRNAHVVETSLYVDVISDHYMAIDTAELLFDYLYRYKSFAFGDTIRASNFIPPGDDLFPLEIFNSNPAGLALHIDTNRVDWNAGVYYLALMDNSFQNEFHKFGWIKFKLFIDYDIDFFGLIIVESGYNLMPLYSIKAGQY